MFTLKRIIQDNSSRQINKRNSNNNHIPSHRVPSQQPSQQPPRSNKEIINEPISPEITKVDEEIINEPISYEITNVVEEIINEPISPEITNVDEEIINEAKNDETEEISNQILDCLSEIKNNSDLHNEMIEKIIENSDVKELIPMFGNVNENQKNKYTYIHYLANSNIHTQFFLKMKFKIFLSQFFPSIMKKKKHVHNIR